MNTTRLCVTIALFLCCVGVAYAADDWQARIHAQKSPALIEWLGDWDRVPNDLRDRDDAQYAICHELQTRGEVDFLLATLATSTNSYGRSVLVSGVLYGIDDKRIQKAFLSRLSEEEDEESYYVANYLAKRGVTEALDVLNRHYYQYPVSSVQWSVTASLFGKYKYRGAASNLVESLDAASLNLAGAACDSLQKIFPDSPRHFNGPTAARVYFAKRVDEESNVHPRSHSNVER